MNIHDCITYDMWSEYTRDDLRLSVQNDKLNNACVLIMIFHRFFKEYPNFFPKFKELFKEKDVTEIPGTPELSAQSANIKGFISKIVDSLDDPGTMGAHCSTFATNHRDRMLHPDDIQVTH